MELHDLLDNKANEKIISYKDFCQFHIETESERYDLECKRLSTLNRREKRIAAKFIEESDYEWRTQQYINAGLIKNRSDIKPEQITLLNAIYLLELHGYTKTSKELNKVLLRYSIASNDEINKEIINCVLDGAIKKNRSSAASGHRHHLHDEIVAIIKATWEKNPALSKKKLVSKLSRRYEGRIDEGTLNSWIKKENLAPPPPPPGQHKNSNLVIPPEYA
ncbi:hypothetical protein OD635_001672 [Salmonella enterica]|nr:hypothetical protein [Salmonella enterica]